MKPISNTNPSAKHDSLDLALKNIEFLVDLCARNVHIRAGLGIEEKFLQSLPIIASLFIKSL